MRQPVRPGRCPECGGTGFITPPPEQTRGVFPPDEAAPQRCPVCHDGDTARVPDDGQVY